MSTTIAATQTTGATGTTAQTTSSTQTPQFVDPAARTSLSASDFMNLFVTQLEYQDPTQPMDSASMATQVAQFDMVNLMTNNNTAINKLVASETQRTQFDAVNYLGRQVSYTGDKLTVGSSGPLPFNLTLNKPAASCVVTIKDSSGNIVKSWDMGPLGQGSQGLSWDGKDASGTSAPAGTYTVSIDAKDAQGNPVTVTTQTTGTVASVKYASDGSPLFDMKDGSEISITDIQAING